MRKMPTFAVVVVAALTWSASTAVAQDAPSDAESHFQHGVELSNQGKWGEAEAEFRQALAIEHTWRYQYNLALALSQQGQFVAALRVAREIIAAPQADLLFQNAASDLVDRLTPRVAKLVVTATGELGSSTTVWVDDQHVDDPGTAFEVDPGVHRVEARSAAGEVRASRELDVASGTLTRVELTPAAPPAPKQVTTSLSLEAESATGRPGEGEDGTSLVGQWWFWAGVGAVLVTAVAVTVGIMSASGPDPVTGDTDTVFIRGALR